MKGLQKYYNIKKGLAQSHFFIKTYLTPLQHFYPSKNINAAISCTILKDTLYTVSFMATLLRFLKCCAWN